MPRKKKDDKAWMAVGLYIGLLFLLPCIICSMVYYYIYNRRFPEGAHTQQVFDVKSLREPLVKGTVALGIFAAAILIGIDSLDTGNGGSTPLKWLGLILALIIGLIGMFYVVPRYWAATYFGMRLDTERDVLVFRKDMASYRLTDYLKARIFFELGDLETVPLTSIRRITREAGKSLYVHGPFGSRAIRFTNKQKRDECIVAIEAAINRRLTQGELGQ